MIGGCRDAAVKQLASVNVWPLDRAVREHSFDRVVCGKFAPYVARGTGGVHVSSHIHCTASFNVHRPLPCIVRALSGASATRQCVHARSLVASFDCNSALSSVKHVRVVQQVSSRVGFPFLVAPVGLRSRPRNLRV